MRLQTAVRQQTEAKHGAKTRLFPPQTHISFRCEPLVRPGLDFRGRNGGDDIPRTEKKDFSAG